MIQSGRLDEFKKNPQAFMEAVVKIINKEKQNMIVDGIKYEKIGDHEYFSQTLFEEQELIGYLKKSAVEVTGDKSIYNYIQYDSEVEKSFARRPRQGRGRKDYMSNFPHHLRLKPHSETTTLTGRSSLTKTAWRSCIL